MFHWFNFVSVNSIKRVNRTHMWIVWTVQSWPHSLKWYIFKFCFNRSHFQRKIKYRKIIWLAQSDTLLTQCNNYVILYERNPTGPDGHWYVVWGHAYSHSGSTYWKSNTLREINVLFDVLPLNFIGGPNARSIRSSIKNMSYQSNNLSLS